MTAAEAALEALADLIADRVAEKLRNQAQQQISGFETVSIPKAAKLAGVGEERMRRWIAEDKVPVVDMGPDEQPMVRLAALEQALRLHERGTITASDGVGAPRQTAGRRLAR